MRGLNAPARRASVRKVVDDSHYTIVCLQETKLAAVDADLVRQLIGPQFAENFFYLPADGTSGGILLASSGDFFELSDRSSTANTISACVRMEEEGTMWQLAGVYGPQGDTEKEEFIEELRGLAALPRDSWLILGDFNLIYRAADKSNANLNRRLMASSRLPSTLWK